MRLSLTTPTAGSVMASIVCRARVRSPRTAPIANRGLQRFRTVPVQGNQTHNRRFESASGSVKPKHHADARNGQDEK
jgi:hypothetical protein